MKRFNRYILATFYWLCIFAMFQITAIAAVLPKPFAVLPQPQQVELLKGAGLEYIKLQGLRQSAEPVFLMPETILSRLKHADTDGAGIVSLALAQDTSLPESHEGYVLTIQQNRASITARGSAGLFYGCQTLEQLLEDARDTGTAIPALKITDSPALSWRAVQFDVKHHLDHMWYYYESIDRLARYKINAVIFEFEDKLRYRRQPIVAAPQAISIDEMAALTRYARERHIEISPLIQGLGHATFILKHDAYAHLRELHNNRWAFCPLHEGTYQVLFDLYRDAMEATPGSRYLHVGGDEIGNIGLCPRCKPTADAEGVFGLNMYWLNRVSEFATTQGRTPIFWDDMPLKYAGVVESLSTRSDLNEQQATDMWAKGGPVLDGLLEKFPKNCLYMRWNYSMARQPGNRMALQWYKDRGLKAVIATAAQAGPAALLPFDGSGASMTDQGVVAIQSFIRLAAELKVDGMLCTAWDDRSLHMETYWRGFLASAEFSWSPELRTLAAFDAAYFQREYGPETAGYTSVYGELRKAVEFWTAALSTRGNRLDHDNALQELQELGHWLPPADDAAPKAPVDFTTRVIGVPDPANPGSWSTLHRDRLTQAAIEMERYQQTSQQLQALSTKTIRHHYHWELFTALNDFQITAASLLLALQASDVPGADARQAGMRRVQAALEQFDESWSRMQQVYARTRFIAYPENYVKDRYFHFASQREDLSYLIQAEEMVHQKVREWMKRVHSN